MVYRKKLVDRLRQEEVAIPAVSIFVGLGYLQYGENDWQGSYCLLYHILPHPFELTSERLGGASVRDDFCCNQKACNRLRKKG